MDFYHINVTLKVFHTFTPVSDPDVQSLIIKIDVMCEGKTGKIEVRVDGLIAVSLHRTTG